MPPLKQPPSLYKLALDAVSQYVVIVGHKVFNKICKRVSKKALKSQPLPNLQLLNEALYESIPCTLWSELQPNVLRGILHLADKARCRLDFFLFAHSRCRSFIHELLLVLVAPYITSLELFGIEQENNILLPYLPEMKNLKVLTTNRQHSVLPSSLISFTWNYSCTDKMLIVVANNCKNLQNLDVSESLGITDASLVSISKLQNLKNLKIYATNISRRGFLTLIQERKRCHVASTPQMLKNLQELEYHDIHTGMLHAIANSSLNIISLTIGASKCDLRKLSLVKNLKKLKVIEADFRKNHVDSLLEIIGHQLKVLSLVQVENVDLALTGTSCVNLEVLGLQNTPNGKLIDGTPDRSIYTEPAFKNLKSLYIQRSCRHFLEYVLIRTSVLSFLVILGMPKITDEFIFSILAKNPLKHLKKLKIHSSRKLTVDSARYFICACPNLSGIEYSGCINAPENKMAEMIEGLQRKNYDIAYDSD